MIQARRIRFFVVVLVNVALSFVPVYADITTGVLVARNRTLSTHVHMPVMAGWPAPVAALYTDMGGWVITHDPRPEPYPVGVAVWEDGTVIWSMNRNGFRAPYAIGKVSESVIRELQIGRAHV